jgi:ABC-2 type transport system permease protein
MKRDFLAVFRKEWKEILPGRAAGGARLRPLIMVGLMGILVPLQAKDPQRYFEPLGLIGLVWVFFVAVFTVAPDTFGGERERHTLETLLASRLSDQAILIGKLAACTSYGWLVTIITIVVGVITINAANWSGHVLFYRSAASWLSLILLPPLVGGAVASAGILVSLHAATVRQAQQTLTFGIVAVGLALSFGLPSLLKWFARNLAAWSAAEVVLAGSAVFLAVDLVLVLAALNRFQRSKLVLD